MTDGIENLLSYRPGPNPYRTSSVPAPSRSSSKIIGSTGHTGRWAYRSEHIQGIDPTDRFGVGITITQCKDRSYCCGNGTIRQPRCDQRNGVFLLNGDVSVSSTATESSATNSFSTARSSSFPPSSLLATNSFSTASSSSSPPSFPPPTSSSPPSQNKTGIIVSTVLGTALIHTIGVAIFLLKKSRRKRLQAVAKDQALASQTACQAGDLCGGVELNGRDHEVELNGRDHKVELDVRGYEVELVG